MKFHVTLQKEPHGGYVARCLELPGALSQGETEDETLANIKDAILDHYRYDARAGRASTNSTSRDPRTRRSLTAQHSRSNASKYFAFNGSESGGAGGI